MTNEKISIIVPVYNTSKYIRDCINSITSQTYDNLEIVIVNDGSTDNSAHIISELALKDSRIKVIHQENQGLSGARNIGIAASSGSYIMFLDSDDWIDLETCETALKEIKAGNGDVLLWSYIREYRSASKPVLLFDNEIKVWDENNIKNLYRQFVGLTNEQLSAPQKTDSIVTAWGKLYTRDAIGDNRFVDTKIIGTEDALFNIQVFSKVKRAVYIPDAFSHYRKDNEESLTHKYKKNLVYQWKKLYSMIEAQLIEENASQDFFAALNNRISLSLIGLGLNVIGDRNFSISHKLCELKKILDMPHYEKAISVLETEYLPIHWKLFFGCAKRKYCLLLYILLVVMDDLRKR